MKLILLGAPGAGKGTQAEVIAEHYHIPAISTGNILREAIKNGTDTGIVAKSFIDKGELVPDEIVIKLLAERLSKDDCKNGYILDGFPRTMPQAEALDGLGADIDRVIDIEVSEAEIIKRISGRRVCSTCGASYHVDFKPTRVLGVCNKCGGETVLRDDDKPSTVLARLEVYHKQTEPLKAYYTARKKLYTVQGQDEIKDTSSLVLQALEA